jgi:hypothetical protein
MYYFWSILLCGLFLAPGLSIPVTQPSATQLLKRAPGDSPVEPIEARFNISGWRDIAELNCYNMLCIRGGNRI